MPKKIKATVRFVFTETFTYTETLAKARQSSPKRVGTDRTCQMIIYSPSAPIAERIAALRALVNAGKKAIK